ncbi:MAG: NAD(P)-binding domain-containing protein, partial [Bacteroidota bacterium]
MYDVIIIGAGPIGLSCGIAASKRNLSYLIIEKGHVDRVVVNRIDQTTFFYDEI